MFLFTYYISLISRSIRNFTDSTYLIKESCPRHINHLCGSFLSNHEILSYQLQLYVHSISYCSPDVNLSILLNCNHYLHVLYPISPLGFFSFACSTIRICVAEQEATFQVYLYFVVINGEVSLCPLQIRICVDTLMPVAQPRTALPFHLKDMVLGR